MTALRVPDEEERSALLDLAAMPSGVVDQILDNIRRQSPRLDSEAFVARSTDGLSSEVQAAARRALEALLALNLVRTAQDLSIERFATDVAESPDLALPVDKRLGLTQRVQKLLDCEPLQVTSKASDILTEFSSSFDDCRIISEIRPVFGDDVTEVPGAAVVLHTLRITHFTGNEYQEFFVGLDSNDLTKLSRVIERAKRKDATLRSLLRRSGVHPLDDKDE